MGLPSNVLQVTARQRRGRGWGWQQEFRRGTRTVHLHAAAVIAILRIGWHFGPISQLMNHQKSLGSNFTELSHAWGKTSHVFRNIHSPALFSTHLIFFFEKKSWLSRSPLNTEIMSSYTSSGVRVVHFFPEYFPTTCIVHCLPRKKEGEKMYYAWIKISPFSPTHQLETVQCGRRGANPPFILNCVHSGQRLLHLQ